VFPQEMPVAPSVLATMSVLAPVPTLLTVRVSI
jgi:hypothetical protein